MYGIAENYSSFYWLRHEKDAVIVVTDLSSIGSSYTEDGWTPMFFANVFDMITCKVKWHSMIEIVNTNILLFEAENSTCLLLDKTRLIHKITIKPTWGSSDGMTYVSWKDDEL